MQCLGKRCLRVTKEDKDESNREQKADQARWKHDNVEETTFTML